MTIEVYCDVSFSWEGFLIDSGIDFFFPLVIHLLFLFTIVSIVALIPEVHELY